MLPLRLVLISFCALVTFALTGCPEEQVKIAAVPEPIAITQPESKAPPPNPNAIELNIGETVRTDGCQAQLVTFSGERPSVLTIKSYADAQQEKLPSAMIQAHVAARDPASLTGTIVKAEVYLMTPGDVPPQETAGNDGELTGVVWHTPPGTPADIRITSVDGQRLVGEIVSGQLINTLTQQRVPLTGRFTGPLQ